MEKFWILKLTTEKGTELVRTKAGRWCYMYVGMNDGMWKRFDNEEDAAKERDEVLKKTPELSITYIEPSLVIF